MADDEMLAGKRSMAIDEIGTVGYQVIKLAHGAADAATLVSSASGLPVNVVTFGATVTVDSELPAAAALGDGTANPTAPAVGSFLHGWNGATWDRLDIDANDNLNVNVNAALPAGTNNIGDVDILSIAAGDNNIGNVDIVSIAAGDNNIGNVDIVSIAAGDNNIGNVDIVTVPADPFGSDADAASASGSISAKLRAIATALGITALDLGSGTGGSRTLRSFQDTAQWVGGTGVDTSAVQRVSLATNVALPTGTNAIGKLAANSGVDIGDVDVTSSVSSDFEHFSNLDVDTAAEQLTAYACKFGVQIKADDDNSSSVYVGKSDVTAGTTDATDGFRLKAGQGVFVPVNNANLLYVIGGANNQKVFVIAA